MLGLTNLGIVHTAISLVAVAAGFVSFFRWREISFKTTAGRWYVVMTVLTCLTGFGIFQHGGFGLPHALGILTLATLAVAAAAGASRKLDGPARYVEAVSYTATFFFHFIPAITETVTRLPVGAPLVTDRDGPELQAAAGAVMLGLIVTAVLQVRRMRKARTAP